MSFAWNIQVFAARRGTTWLSWDDTVAVAERLGLPTVLWNSKLRLQSKLKKEITQREVVCLD